MKFIITRATKGTRGEAVFTAHEGRPCGLHGVAAFLSLQSSTSLQWSITQEFIVIVSQACVDV